MLLWTKDLPILLLPDRCTSANVFSGVSVCSFCTLSKKLSDVVLFIVTVPNFHGSKCIQRFQFRTINKLQIKSTHIQLFNMCIIKSSAARLTFKMNTCTPKHTKTNKCTESCMNAKQCVNTPILWVLFGSGSVIIFFGGGEGREKYLAVV